MTSWPEEWRDIPGYEGRYQASSLGRIRSKKRGVLRQWVGDRGYSMVQLRDNGKKKTPAVHRLVALAFLPKPDGRDIVNHRNGIRTDNAVTNLEWATTSENISHGKNILNHRSGGKPPRAVRCIDTGQVYPSLAEASRATGAAVPAIWACCKGNQQRANCLRWEYVEAET